MSHAGHRPPPLQPVTRPRIGSRQRGDGAAGVKGGYHDSKLGAKVVNIVVGGCIVTGEDNMAISTTLGSCIAACLFDPVARIGGMNHFLLPDSTDDRLSTSSRYGSAAMEQLINRILSATGRRDRLRAKIFGGANVTNGTLDIGLRNIEFVMEYLADEGIPTLSWDVGGTQARAIRFFPASGKSLRRLLGDARVAKDILASEASFLDNLRHTKIEGDIELF